MIIPALQFVSCIVLAVAAGRLIINHSTSEAAHRSLRPFIVVASILGWCIIYPFAVEIFVAYYSGAIYEMEAVSFRFNGVYWWVYSAGFILPLLPMIGLIPWVGRRPTLIVGIALLSLIPVSFTPVVTIISRIIKEA